MLSKSKMNEMLILEWMGQCDHRFNFNEKCDGYYFIDDHKFGESDVTSFTFWYLNSVCDDIHLTKDDIVNAYKRVCKNVEKINFNN